MVLIKTEKQLREWKELMEKEEKEYEKIQHALEKKDKKALDRFFDAFLGKTSKTKKEDWL